MSGSIDSGLGKKAESKIKLWLDRLEDGYCFYRIPDQLTGFKHSDNPCDFICFKSPNLYWIESKATFDDRFDFSNITQNQHDSLMKYSKVDNSYGLIMLLFASYQRLFILDINDIDRRQKSGKKSLNIKKIDDWNIPYSEVRTISSRKNLLDYEGEIDYYIDILEENKDHEENY